MEEPVYGFLQQRWRQELQRIPNQRAVEAALGEIQALAQEIIRPARIGLVRYEIPFPSERFIQGVQDVVRKDTMSQRGDEADVGLARARKIQDR